VQEVILGNIVAAADALDGKIFDVLGSVLEQLGVDYGKLMLRASAGGSNTEAAIRQARTVTAEQYTRATGQQQEIEQQLATQPDPNTFLSHLAKDRLDAINPAVVAAFMRILSEARRWGMSDWLREYLYRLQAPPGTSLPSALGGKNRAVIAASVDSLIEARREGADLAQAIVLGPAEPAYRTLVEAILRDSADHLASGAVLDDPSALTPYELFVFDSAILKRQGSRILRSAHPILVRVDRSGSRTVAWQSVSHLMAVQAAQEASSASVSIPSFRAGPQTDAEMEAELEIARLAERARAELHVWVDRVSAQLDRLQDEVMEPYQDLPFEERRTRWESLTKAVSERKRKIQEAAELTVQPPRLVGRVYVRVGASSDRVENPPLSGVSNILSGSLDDRERMLVDTEMRAMRVCKKALEDEGFVVDDVHQSRCGYDLHARRAYEQRLVEVKGLQGDLSQGVTMESSEWLMAQQHRDDYWVYVVVQCTGEPQLFGAYRNPVALFGEDKKLIRRFHIGAATLRKVHTV
jgi:hypothetical protein